MSDAAADDRQAADWRAYEQARSEIIMIDCLECGRPMPITYQRVAHNRLYDLDCPHPDCQRSKLYDQPGTRSMIEAFVARLRPIIEPG